MINESRRNEIDFFNFFLEIDPLKSNRLTTIILSIFFDYLASPLIS